MCTLYSNYLARVWNSDGLLKLFASRCSTYKLLHYSIFFLPHKSEYLDNTLRVVDLLPFLHCWDITKEENKKKIIKQNTRYTDASQSTRCALAVALAHYLLHRIMKVQQNNVSFSASSRSRKFLGCSTASASVLQPWDLFITVILIYHNSPKQKRIQPPHLPYDIHTSLFQSKVQRYILHRPYLTIRSTPETIYIYIRI